MTRLPDSAAMLASSATVLWPCALAAASGYSAKRYLDTSEEGQTLKLPAVLRSLYGKVVNRML